MIVPAGVFFLKKEHFASKQSARHLSISIIRLHLTLCTGVVRTKLSAAPRSTDDIIISSVDRLGVPCPYLGV